MLTEIEGLHLFEIQGLDLERFAYQLHSWRAAKANLGIELADQYNNS